MKLHLFTANYPNGFGESFLNNELPFLSPAFDEVILYPFAKKETIQTAFTGEQNVVYQNSFDTKKKVSLKDKILIIKILRIEWMGISKKMFFLKQIRSFYAMLKQSIYLANWIEEQELDSSDAFYSFWMNEWALALSILNLKDRKRKFIFRINGYDIYDERHPGNYLPFRHFIYSRATKVIPLSKTSATYARSKTKYKDKVEPSYFGTPDLGGAAKKETDVFTVFTCSSAIPLKRLDKIAKVITLLDFPVMWVHHGDGETIQEVERILEGNKTVDFKHSKKVEDYNEVLELQKKLAPDLFINLSTSEGLPVTLMEAQSFGTPILVNNVGSCMEFIRPFTGISADINESPYEIAKKITKLRSLKKNYNPEKIREFWQENFSAKNNYSNFAKEIKAYFNEFKK